MHASDMSFFFKKLLTVCSGVAKPRSASSSSSSCATQPVVRSFRRLSEAGLHASSIVALYAELFFYSLTSAGVLPSVSLNSSRFNLDFNWCHWSSFSK